MVVEPGPLSVTKPWNVASICVPVAAVEFWRIDAASIRPASRLVSAPMTCSGEIELKVERRMREPVTTISSLVEDASSSSSSISSTSSS